MKIKALILSLIAMGFTAPSFAQSDVDTLREQLRALQLRLDQIERDNASKAQQPAAAPAAAAVTPGATPGSFKLPGSDTSVSIGGAIKAVAIQSSRSSGPASAGDELLIPSLIPLDGAPAPAQTDKWKLSAKESRLNVRTSTPTAYGPLTTYIEGDFYGNTGNETSLNGWGFRLRHAWGQLGGFGAGQTWSNALNLTALPELIDFSPPLGLFGGPRQAGFRYTSNFDSGFWAASVENPETNVPGTTTDNDKGPDFTAKVHARAGSADFEVAGILRRLESNVANSGKATAYGLAVSGSLPVTGSDRLVGQVGYGDGIGRYWGAPIADALVVSGQLLKVKASGGYAAWRHAWNVKIRSNLAVSWLSMTNPTGAPATTDKSFRSVHLNTIWSPVTNSDFGFEFVHAERRVVGGGKGDLNRFIAMARYAF